jgi:hypothetical protein
VRFVLYEAGQRFVIVHDDDFQDFADALLESPDEVLQSYWRLDVRQAKNVERAMDMKLNHTPNVVLNVLHDKDDQGGGSGLSFSSWNYPQLLSNWTLRKLKDFAGDKQREVKRLSAIGMQYVKAAQAQLAQQENE